MAYMLVRHMVKDYATWKPVFDRHGVDRKARGSRGGYVFRSADDPNEVLILLEWDSLQSARQFVQASDLPKAMEQAGVADRPDIYFLDEADRPGS